MRSSHAKTNAWSYNVTMATCTVQRQHSMADCVWTKLTDTHCMSSNPVSQLLIACTVICTRQAIASKTKWISRPGLLSKWLHKHKYQKGDRPHLVRDRAAKPAPHGQRHKAQSLPDDVQHFHWDKRWPRPVPPATYPRRHVQPTTSPIAAQDTGSAVNHNMY